MNQKSSSHNREAIRQVLRDYWTQYKSYPLDTLIAFLLPSLGSILVFFVPSLILSKIVNIFVARNEISLTGVGVYIALFGGLWFLGEMFWRIGEHFLIRLETKGVRYLGKIALRRLVDRDYTFFTDNFVGALTKKGLSFSKNFEVFTDILNFRVCNNLFSLIFAVIVLWTYSFWIPLVLICSLLLVISIAFPIIRSRYKLVVARHEASSKMVGRFSDAITNMFAVKSFAKEKVEARTYETYVEKYVDTFKKAADYHNLRLNMSISPLYVVTNVLGLLMAIVFSQKLGLQAGTIIVVFSYYAQTTRIFWEINNVYRNIENSITEAAEFTELFVDPPRVQDVEGATVLKVTKGIIRFEKVGFRYSDDRKEGDEFLENFHLDILSQQKVGLVGPSGAGKTTITKLFLRFLDIQAGSITIDEQDISQITQTSLRENIAYVPQEPLLFHRSILENIAYGDVDATREDVIEAAKIARAHEFIETLPYGYDTLVGERGVKLSGGQRQRVAIARALLKKAPLLILDEATSSLDSESEKYIQEGLFELMKDKTALVIAHRLSTIRRLDRIIVLDQGEIVQDGTHDELIEKPGLYAKLWQHQSGEFIS